MIRAYHAIVTTYGFWLPNDPRGSWSDYVRRWELLQHGEATKVETRRSVAAKKHDWQKRKDAKQELMYPEVKLSGVQCRSVGEGFQQAVRESGYVIWACAILPQHAHLVFARKDDRSAERIVGHLKGRATQKLLKDGLHPLAEFKDKEGNIPSPWTRKGWPVFLETDEDILRAIRYVENNPIKEGKPKQRWTFVVPFEPNTTETDKIIIV